MNILAIETSCDETALSIIETNESLENFQVHSDLVISQIDIHKEYGGVFPAMAKREHAKNIIPLFKESISSLPEGVHISLTHEKKSRMLEILEREPETAAALLTLVEETKIPKIDLIMVTHGPGLAPALWVGVNVARALAIVFDCKVLPVNHMEGHLTSILLKENYLDQELALHPLENFDLPLIGLLISGGHTQLVLVKSWGNYEIIGETIDDAVGEAFDKVARMLGMEYPGGPKISQAAKSGQENESISLPRPMMHSKDYRFSFSGLKTSARYMIQDLEKENLLNGQTVSDISREFEHAVTDVLIKKTLQAIEEYGAKGLIIAGGVSANTFITETFKQKLAPYDIPLYLPERKLCGDNSLMIACAGFMNLQSGTEPIGHSNVAAESNLKL